MTRGLRTLLATLVAGLAVGTGAGALEGLPTFASNPEAGRACPVAGTESMMRAPTPEPSCTFADVVVEEGIGATVVVGAEGGLHRAEARVDSGDVCVGHSSTDAKLALEDESWCAAIDAPESPELPPATIDLPPPPANAEVRPVDAPGLPSPPERPATPDAPRVEAPEAPEGDPARAPEAPPVRLRGSLHLDEERGAPTGRLGAELAAPGVSTKHALGSLPARAPGSSVGLFTHASREDAAPAAEDARVGAQPAGAADAGAPLPLASTAETGGTRAIEPSAPAASTLSASAPVHDVLEIEPLAWGAAGALGALALLRLGPAAAALYHRLTRRQVVSHGTRARILATLSEAPATPTILARRLGIDRTTADYHLRLMESYGLLVSKAAGRERVFAAPHVPTGDGLSAGARRVIDAVRASPGASLSDVARQLGVSKGTVAHHVRRLVDAGRIRAEPRRAAVALFAA